MGAKWRLRAADGGPDWTVEDGSKVFVVYRHPWEEETYGALFHTEANALIPIHPTHEDMRVGPVEILFLMEVTE